MPLSYWPGVSRYFLSPQWTGRCLPWWCVLGLTGGFGLNTLSVAMILPLPGVATLMPLRMHAHLAADNRRSSGVRAALPELVLIYEPSPITTQARSVATQGSIMTAALPFGCGLSALLVHFLTLQKRKSPTVLTAGLETKALTHRWDKINTDSGKVNSSN